MPKRQYKDIKFQSKSLDLINLVNQVIDEYDAQGYELTLRQVYYQLVARGYIPNNERSYKNLGNLINDGRLAGLIDWYAIVDRTRNLKANAHWETPESVIESAKYSYNPENFEFIHRSNIEFKRKGDKKARLPFKIMDNAISGQMKQKSSALYDPMSNNSICINGQLMFINEERMKDMKNIDWKSKLTSRKFWVAVVTFVTSLIIAFGASEAVATQVTGVIMAGASMIAYIIGEGLVDANRTDNTNNDESEGE